MNTTLARTGTKAQDTIDLPAIDYFEIIFGSDTNYFIITGIAIEVIQQNWYTAIFGYGLILSSMLE